ncbi:MAG: hypothetical protein JSC085_000241 [Candidatus Tokpelaia sp. JSC085]|nr:MAG: hypothetical protein JSC085_000241 [Candidatus Tokpelaia sp. JSC085]
MSVSKKSHATILGRGKALEKTGFGLANNRCAGCETYTSEAHQRILLFLRDMDTNHSGISKRESNRVSC